MEDTSEDTKTHPSIGENQLYYVAEDSIATSELPSTLDESQEFIRQPDVGEPQQLLYADRGRYNNNGKAIHPLKLAYADKSSAPNRVGWVTNRKGIILPPQS